MQSTDLNALTDDVEPRDGEGTVNALQYAVHNSEGITIYGDQRWVQDGRAAAANDGRTMVRDVTVCYGRWRPADRPDWRVLVFWYPCEGYCGRGWTWYWEYKGDPQDSAWNLPDARPDWRAVFDEATAALRAKLGEPS